MNKPGIQNSKKGFSLPMALATSLFLIIISTSLIFIALNSMSNTSVDVSGRQAYLNVRSALEYAQAYYSQIDDFSSIGKTNKDPATGAQTEYMLMKDSGGTVNDGASITTQVANTSKSDVTTYVEVIYTPSKDSNPATVKMTAFSKYSDAFGNKAKMARLSVTFTVGGTGPNRLTIISGSGTGSSVITTDSITLNVKKPAGMDYELTYYVWTYPDLGAYADYDESKGHTTFTYDEDVIVKSTDLVDKLNASTNHSSIKPNAEWRTSDDETKKLQQGPNGIMADMGNGWFAGEYFIRSGRVPWFNIIFAKQGSILSPKNSKGYTGAWNIYDSQANEIFHLWYLDPGDKNIYFEFFDTKKLDGNRSYYTKYYKGSGWNGTDGLEDSVLVYVKNPKTTIHFRMKSFDAWNTQTTIAADKQPKITLVENVDGTPIQGDSYLTNDKDASGKKVQKQSTNIPMVYEGCGWWVANVETNRTFNLTMSFLGLTNKKVYNIDANTANNEFWLVYHDEIPNSLINVHTTEETALYDLDVNPDSYVTVHAKVYDYKAGSTPYVTFGGIDLSSSSGRSTLRREYLNALSLKASAYTEETYKEVVKALNGKWEKKDDSGNVIATELLQDAAGNALKSAYELLDDADFIRNQVGPTDSQRIAQADIEYNKATERIRYAVDHLESAPVTPDSPEVQALNEQIALADGMIADHKSNKYVAYGTYEKNAYEHFIRSAGPYDRAKKLNQNDPSLTAATVIAMTDALSDEIAILNANKLNRQALADVITSYSSLDRSLYEDGAWDTFQTALDAARNTLKRADIANQAELDNAKSTLEAAFTDLDTNHRKIILNQTKLNELKQKALALNPSPLTEGAILMHCTQATANAVKTAYNNAVNASPTSQADIDSLAMALETALDNYQIIKPGVSYDDSGKDVAPVSDWTNDKLHAARVTRLWVENKAGYDFYIQAENATSTTTTGILPSNNFTKWGNFYDAAAEDYKTERDTNPAFYYYDINRDSYAKVTVTVIKSTGEGEVQETGKLEILLPTAVGEDNNLAVAIDNSGKPSLSQMVTVYFPVVKNTSSTTYNLLTKFDRLKGKIGSTGVSRDDMYYSIYKYIITDANKTQKFTVIGKSISFDASNNKVETLTTFDLGTLSAGQYVATYTAEDIETAIEKIDAHQASTVTCNPVNVKDVLPAYVLSATQPTGSGDDPQTQPSMATGELSFMNLATTKHLFFTDNKNFSGSGQSGKIFAYFYNSDSDKYKAWPGAEMTYKGLGGMNNSQSIYQIDVPEGYANVIFNDGKGKNEGGLQTVSEPYVVGSRYWCDTTKSAGEFTLDSLVEETYEEEPTPTPTPAPDPDPDQPETAANYIYFTDSEWDSIKWGSDGYACFYDASDKEIGQAWPGYQLEVTNMTDKNNNKIYRVLPPTGAVTVTFNNNHGSKKQQSDGKTAFTRGYGYAKGQWVTDNNGYGRKTFKLTSWVVAEPPSNVEYENYYIYVTNNYNLSNLHIYFWGADGIEFTGGKGPSFPGYTFSNENNAWVNKYNQQVYRIHPPKGATKFIISDGTSTKQSVDVNFQAGWQYWIKETDKDGYYVMDSKKVDDVTGADDDNGNGNDPDDSHSGITEEGIVDRTGVDEVNISGDRLKMAYVGGKKVRLQNRSYWDVYNSFDGQKKNSHNHNIGSGNLFGGTGGASGNDDSDGRLGLAGLSAYYDWYEFKLPVSKGTEYNFALSGMEKGYEYIQTKAVNGARGDVWLEQLSNDIEGGNKATINNNVKNGAAGATSLHYRNINLYTFDPEQSQIGDKITVYFKLPAGWQSDTLEITLTGPFESDTRTVKMTDKLTRVPNETTYYLANISKRTPFIVFRVKDDLGQEHQYKTCLQGGDYCRFVPARNDSEGYWEQFQSDQTALKNKINLLRSTYYGCNIASNYDDNGELPDSATRHYSDGLLSMYSNYSTTKETDGVTYYITKNVDSWSEADAYNGLVDIEDRLNAYRALYKKMQKARQYLAEPLKNSDMSADNQIHGNGGGRYPEYVTRSLKTRQYTEESIQALRDKLAEAEAYFLGNTDKLTLNGATEALERCISGLEVKSEGSIACVLFDAQGKVRNNYSFKIRYSKVKEPTTAFSLSSTEWVEKSVKEYNPERYPIIFLSGSDLTEVTDAKGNKSYEIYNVQFVQIDNIGQESVVGADKGKAVKSVMKMDEAWVYVDTTNPYWSINTASDYREISASTFKQSKATEKQMYNMVNLNKSGDPTKNTYKPMTLLFTNDATVDLVDGTQYTIKAGSYYFDNDDATKDTKSPVYGGKLNLFSTEAMSFFSKDANRGIYALGEKDLNDQIVRRVTDVGSTGTTTWHNGVDFTTGSNVLQSTYVNLEADKGSLTAYAPYSYFTTAGMCFRWSSEDPLYTSAKVTLTAKEFIFSSMGTFDATKRSTRTPQFLLCNVDGNANSLVVDFRTDIYVRYYDEMRILHTFAIREGKYIIKKPKDSTANYIANIYDETYWKGMENITYIGHGTANENGTGVHGALTNGTYGD